MRRGTHSGINNGSKTAQVWGGSGDRLELVTDNSDGAHTPGLERQFPKGNIPVPLPLSWVTRIVSDLERPQEFFQLIAL